MKKVSLAAARIYMSCIERRAKLQKPPATMQSNPYSPRESLSSSPVSRSRCIFFSSSLSFPALFLSVHLTHVRVFRARLRFRSLDAKGRLIVTPFLSAAFTAAVTRLWKNEDRSERRGTIDFSAVHVTTDQPLSSPMVFRKLSISVARIFLSGARKSAAYERTVSF